MMYAVCVLLAFPACCSLFLNHVVPFSFWPPPSVSPARPLEAGGAERTRQRQRIWPQQLLIARCVTLTFITALNTHKALPESEAHGDDKLSIMHVPSFSRTESSATGLYGVHTRSGARAWGLSEGAKSARVRSLCVWGGIYARGNFEGSFLHFHLISF